MRRAKTPVITANALRGHKDIAVFRFADVLNRFNVNSVEMSDKQNRSESMNENEIVLTSSGVAFEFLAEAFEELLLSGTQEVFQVIHAETSQER